MNRLNKARIARRDELDALLNARKKALEGAINRFNEAVGDLWIAVEEAADAYNEAVDEANEFRSDVHEEMDGYFNDRSEKWQEGEKGSDYSDWMNEWDMEFDQIEVERPAEAEAPDCSAVGALENLPEVPG